MRRQQKFSQAHSFESVFVLLLISVLAICTLFVVVFGARVYGSVVKSADANFVTRTGLSYVANKIRCYDADQLSVINTEAGKTLRAEENIGGDIYDTYLYYYNGSIYELPAAAGQSFKAADGTEILKCGGLDFSMPSPDAIKVSVTDASGKPSGLTLTMRSASKSS